MELLVLLVVVVLGEVEVAAPHIAMRCVPPQYTTTTTTTTTSVHHRRRYPIGCRGPLGYPRLGAPKRRACTRPPSGTSGTGCAARRTQRRVAWVGSRPTPPPGKSPAPSRSCCWYRRRRTIRSDGHSPSRAAVGHVYPTRSRGRVPSPAPSASTPERRRRLHMCINHGQCNCI
eukprot:COSAG02_NODE_5571_length_4222_cov_8.387339_3_plen_173_part_00